MGGCIAIFKANLLKRAPDGGGRGHAKTVNPPWRPYWVAARKGFARNLQYRYAHMINNVASAIFGFVFIAIWQAVAEPRFPVGPYTGTVMTHYIAFSQVTLWLTTFLSYGLGIPDAVRTGSVSLDLLRPVRYAGFILAKEAGLVAYNAVYRSLPLVLIFTATTGFHFPPTWSTYFLAAIALILGAYVGLCLAFMVGLAAFWTTEVRWAHYVYLTLVMSLEGQIVPVDLLPGLAGILVPWLPFPALAYYPSRVYLGLSGAEGLLVPLIWAVLLTCMVGALSARARRRVEVQGG